MSAPGVKRRAVAMVLACVVVCQARGALHAAPDDAKAQAEARFREGRAAIEAGDCAQAVVLLQESLQLYPGSGALLNLAHCQAELGAVASAWRSLQDLLAVLSPDDPRRPIAEEQATALEARIPRLRLELGARSPAPERIVLDSVEVAPVALPVELPVDPGRLALTVKWPDGDREERLLELTEGARQVITLEAPQPPPPPPAPPPRAPARPMIRADVAPPPVWPALAASGVALTGLTLGVVLTMEANRRSDTAQRQLEEANAAVPQGQSACPLSPECAEMAATLREHDRYRDFAVAGYVVGGAAAVGAAALWWWSAQGGRGAQRGARVTPVFLISGGGLHAEGAF